MKITDAKQPDVQCNNNSNIALNANFLKRIETIKDFSLENELSQSFDIPHVQSMTRRNIRNPAVSIWTQLLSLFC